MGSCSGIGMCKSEDPLANKQQATEEKKEIEVVFEEDQKNMNQRSCSIELNQEYDQKNKENHMLKYESRICQGLNGVMPNFIKTANLRRARK